MDKAIFVSILKITPDKGVFHKKSPQILERVCVPKDCHFSRELASKSARSFLTKDDPDTERITLQISPFNLPSVVINMALMFNELDQSLASELLATIQFFNQKGWSPATSTNYSVRSSQENQFIISRSGVDKSQFSLQDLILINEDGNVLPPFNKPGIKSSAETEIHTALYKKYPEINCVLHTHSVLGTVLSNTMLGSGEIIFENYEILKGLEGNTTHSLSEGLPVVPNSQAMPDILRDMTAHLISPLKIHGFLIAGHGLYTWGKDIPTAKRHVETFEFLFECFHTMRRY